MKNAIKALIIALLMMSTTFMSSSAEAARNGSGTMSIPYPNFIPGTTISASQVNSNNSNITTEITNSLPRDGQAAPTANIPWGGFKITNLGNGTALTDAANFGQVQSSSTQWCGTFGGTGNALTCTPTPAIGAYAAGQIFRGIASADSTSTATLNVSSQGTKAIQNDGNALSTTLKIESGKVYQFVYDGTQFQLDKVWGPTGSAVTLGAVSAASVASTGAVSGTTFTGDGFVPTSTTATGNRLYLPASNTLGWATNGTGRLQLTTAALSPITNDALSLGTSSLGYSDLYLASTAIIDFGNNNMRITHSSGQLAISGGNVTGLGVSTGTSFNAITGLSSQSEMEAASATTTVVTPALVKYHPGVAKVWARIEYNTGTPSATASYNVSSITDNAGGDGNVNFTVSMSSATFPVWTTNATSAARPVYGAPLSTSSGRYVVNGGNDDAIAFMVMGDQ